MKARKVRRARGAETVDFGTPERARQGELLPRPTALAGVIGRRAKYECRLDWYWDKASINDRQHEAGIRFRHDWHLAAAAPKTVATYGPRLGKGFEFHEVQIAARARVARAVLALGEELTSVAIDVCGFDNWASGRLPRLRKALDRLADEYGLPRSG